MGVVTEQTRQTVPLAERTPEEIAAFLADQQDAYARLRERGHSLDLTRGKPSTAQLDLADALLRLPTGVRDADGVDVRNYGGLAGIGQLRAVFAELLSVDPPQLVAGGNSSLVMMREVLTYLWLKGGVASERPWAAEEKVTFVCPVPGYDRHFTLLDWFGIDTVTVPMNEDGPDAEAVARLVAADPTIKGMWVVPTYANPTGSVVSDEVARRLASMETAAPDFTIFWDNAYALHHLTEEETPTADLLALCAEAGHPHRAVEFASTSKITYAGAGVAFLAGSPETAAWYVANLGKGAIGPDKLNQLRHAEFFGSAQGVRDHMQRHREILAPKFAEVDRILDERLGGLDVASWTRPAGGYFVSLDVLDGTASRVVELAKEAGIALTPAGASFPGGHDPRDRNIRLAPSFPELPEVTAPGAGQGRQGGEATGADRAGSRRSVTRLPKAHLHLHFTGSMRHETLLELAERDGHRLPDALVEDWPPQLSAADEKGWFRFQRLYDVARSVLRTEDDVRRLVREAAEDDRRDGSRWLEIQVDPSGYAARFGGITAFTDLVLDAVRVASREVGIGMAVVIAANRTRHPLDARTLARLAAQYAGRGVVGFGLSNDERRGSTRDFAPAFRIAERAGLLLAPHGGELRGPDSARVCLEELHADRLGHGIRSVEDPELLDLIVSKGVALEVCPVSNVALGVYSDLTSVPLPELMEAGATIALGADDPLLFGSRLAGQYATMRAAHDLSDAQLADLARSSVRASRAPDEDKLTWLAEIDEWMGTMTP